MTAGLSLDSASVSRCGSTSPVDATSASTAAARRASFVRSRSSRAERGDRRRPEAGERGHHGAAHDPAPFGQHRHERVDGRRAALNEPLNFDHPTAVVGGNGERGFPHRHREFLCLYVAAFPNESSRRTCSRFARVMSVTGRDVFTSRVWQDRGLSACTRTLPSPRERLRISSTDRATPSLAVALRRRLLGDARNGVRLVHCVFGGGSGCASACSSRPRAVCLAMRRTSSALLDEAHCVAFACSLAAVVTCAASVATRFALASSALAARACSARSFARCRCLRLGRRPSRGRPRRALRLLGESGHRPLGQRRELRASPATDVVSRPRSVSAVVVVWATPRISATALAISVRPAPAPGLARPRARCRSRDSHSPCTTSRIALACAPRATLVCCAIWRISELPSASALTDAALLVRCSSG